MSFYSSSEDSFHEPDASEKTRDERKKHFRTCNKQQTSIGHSIYLRSMSVLTASR